MSLLRFGSQNFKNLGSSKSASIPQNPALAFYLLINNAGKNGSANLFFLQDKPNTCSSQFDKHFMLRD